MNQAGVALSLFNRGTLQNVDDVKVDRLDGRVVDRLVGRVVDRLVGRVIG